MIAGLPKRTSKFLALLSILLVVAWGAASQGVQTPSATLQPIIVALATNPSATAEQQQQLTDLFGTAIDAGLMVPDQALDMLARVEWPTLATAEVIVSAVDLLSSVLDSLIAGAIADPMTELEARLVSLAEQPVFDAIAASAFATEEQILLLTDAFSAAFASGFLTPEQGLELLAFLGWDLLELEEEITRAVALLTETLSGVVAGEIVDPVAALTDAYNAELTPDGIVNAIGKAGVTDTTIISQVQALVASGIPPGIVLRVTKDALRNERDPAEALAILADSYGDPSDPDMSPGQAANQATQNGSFMYQEQEEEQNSNVGDSEEPEVEKNANGPKETSKGKGKSNNGGKKK